MACPLLTKYAGGFILKTGGDFLDFTNLITPVALDISQGTAAVLSVIGVAAALASCFFWIPFDEVLDCLHRLYFGSGNQPLLRKDIYRY